MKWHENEISGKSNQFKVEKDKCCTLLQYFTKLLCTDYTIMLYLQLHDSCNRTCKYCVGQKKLWHPYPELNFLTKINAFCHL